MIPKYSLLIVTRITQTLLVFIALCCTSASAITSSTTVAISAQSDNQQFNEQLHYIKSSNDQLSIHDVISLTDDQWQPNDSSIPSFGITSATVWFRASLTNTDDATNSFILLCNYGSLDYVRVFWVDSDSGNIIQTQKAGDHLPFKDRPIAHLTYAFPFDLGPKERIDVYVKVKSGGNVVVPLSIFQSDLFFKDQKMLYMAFTFLLSVLFITAVYNFFIFFQTKEILFLSFSAFSFSLMLLSASHSYFSFQFLWPNSARVGEKILIFEIVMVTLSHLWFSSCFLSLRGKIRKLFFALAIPIATLTTLIPLLDYRIILSLALASSMLTAIINLIISSFLWVKNHENARVYTLAWSPFIIGMFITAAVRFNIFSFNWLTEYSGIFGSVITTIVLSIALGNRIRSEKQNRLEAQNSAISNLQKYQSLFENSSEGIFFIDDKNQFTAANPAFLMMLGYPDLSSLQHEAKSGIRSLLDDKDYTENIFHELEENGEFRYQEMIMRKQNGGKFWVSISCRAVQRSDNNRFKIEGSLIDITARKKTEQKLTYLASHDPLTGTLNRREFETQLTNSLAEAKKSDERYCVLYMDLDQFKVVNDTCGHTAGDILLRELTQLMENKVGDRGILARLGGDEFGVLLKHTRIVNAQTVADEILSLVKNYRFTYKESIFNLGISIGLVEVTGASDSPENIMSLADTACYVAKDEGRNRVHVYSAENAKLKKRRTEMELVISINNALENNRFELHSQAIADTDNNQNIFGYEILIRMRDEQNNVVSPGAFIPAAERFNLMQKIDYWVIENTFRYLSEHREALYEGIHYSINLSGHSMTEESLSDHIDRCFNRYNIPYENICFEITETAAVYNLSQLTELMKKYQKLGCLFSLDDFGSGFSSYGYLKNLPVNCLKIDGSFVIQIDNDPVDYAMVKSINQVAQALGMKTIAEFVETPSIIEKLKGIGVDYIQGFGVSGPNKLDLFDHNLVETSTLRVIK